MKPERIVFIEGDDIVKNMFKKDLRKYDFLFENFTDEIDLYILFPLREFIINEHIYSI